jgi:ACR3 family arsenite efflux pump ArsB
MSLDRAINVLVRITLIEMMVLLGLQVTFTELAQAAKNWWLLARAAMANYVLFPAVTIPNCRCRAAAARIGSFPPQPQMRAGTGFNRQCPSRKM